MNINKQKNIKGKSKSESKGNRTSKRVTYKHIKNYKKSSSVEQCQCDPNCKNSPLKDSPFCKEHSTYCPRISPLSGYEPEYNPSKYNKHDEIKDSHNCFAYAFDYLELPTEKCTKNNCNIHPFPQPGRTSGHPKWSKVKGKRCPDILGRLFGDVKDLAPTTFEEKCPNKSSKIALVVDESDDYHFYRQDSNGYWSHKPGATNVINKDANGRKIYDPQLASRKYDNSGLNYDVFCSYLCAPKNKKIKLKRGGGNRNITKKIRKINQKNKSENN